MGVLPMLSLSTQVIAKKYFYIAQKEKKQLKLQY